MSPEVHAAMRMVHIVCGTGSFVLGGIVALLPKFGRTSFRHRWLGRAYAVCMLTMASMSVPLAWNRQDMLLFTIGILTLIAVAFGWRAIRLAKRLPPAEADGRVRWISSHLIAMGSSYIAAWTAFFVANHPFGYHGPVTLLFYWFGPTIVGVPIVVRTVRRFRASVWTKRSSSAAAEGIGEAAS